MPKPTDEILEHYNDPFWGETYKIKTQDGEELFEFVLELPSDVIQILEAKAAKYGYEDVSEFVVKLITEHAEHYLQVLEYFERVSE